MALNASCHLLIETNHHFIQKSGGLEPLSPISSAATVSLTYKILTTSQATYLHNLVSLQSPRGTRSSSIATDPTRITKFGQLILGKIIKIVATRCQILRIKCTKFDFGWGSAPDPAKGAHSAPPDPLAGFKGAYF